MKGLVRLGPRVLLDSQLNVRVRRRNDALKLTSSGDASEQPHFATLSRRSCTRNVTAAEHGLIDEALLELSDSIGHEKSL